MAKSAKNAAEKKFDEILRRILRSKPLSRSEIGAKLRDRRKASRAQK